MPIFREEGACVACGQWSDRYGDHAISCGSQGERISRHNHLRDALYYTAVSASLGPTREDRALLPGIEQRPADVLIPHWSGGQDAALDVTVVNPLQIQTTERSAVEPGYALQWRYSQKWSKYGDLCKSEGIDFQALVVSTLGGWHEVATRTIRKLGQALARANGQEEGDVIKHLFGRLGILLVKGNCSLILNRTPTTIDTHINGEM